MSNTDTPPAVPVLETLDSGNPATPGSRILAALIDGILGAIVSIVPILGGLVALVYFFTKDSLPFLDGQSVGKKIMKIRAVTEAGESLKGNWGAVALRQVVFWIPFFLIVETVMIFTDKPQHLRFGDKWAKTRVVKVG